jgi:DNA polymerase-3 subunit alpha
MDHFNLGPVHLAVRSHYSTGKAAATTKEIVKRAKEIGAKAVGLMDEDSLSGGLDFAMACRAAGIKPIVGMRVGLQVKSLGSTVPARIGLIALKKQGLINLNRLTAIMHTRVPAYITNDELIAHADGVALLTGNSKDGVLARLLKSVDPNAAALALTWFARKFPGRTFVEIERPGILDIEDEIIKLAMGGQTLTAVDGRVLVPSTPALPLIGTTDIRYTTPEKHAGWALIDADYRSRKVSFNAITNPPAEALMYMRSEADLRDLFADLPEATNTANKLAIMANAAPEKAPVILPKWPDLQPGENEDDLLRSMATKGLNDRFASYNIPQEDQPKYIDRLNFELGVISRMGFSAYFMMVSDFVNYALRQDIPVGPGRGSGAGSLVAWAIGITRPDPIRYGLLFERFLNPDRVSMPDFDVDFCGNRRIEVIEYIRNRYGDASVANIATFGEIKARKGLKTVQRVLTNDGGQELHHSEANVMTKQMPNDNAIIAFVKKYNEGDKKKTGGEPLPEAVTLETIVHASPALWNDLAEGNRRVKEGLAAGIPSYSIKNNIFSATRFIEGYYNVAGTHAAGLAVSDGALTDRIPMLPDRSPGRQGHIVCGYDMKYAEIAGLVKFDILGLKTATMIGAASRQIRNRISDFDIETVPVDDPQVMENFRNGLTSGVFQFESEGMRAALKQVSPTSLLDLSAAVALYRPGPMGNIPTFGARKRGEEAFSYFEPAEKTSMVLKETYGIIVYQEQVMQIAQVCAGFSLAAADLMRRAMGKKNAQEMEALKVTFIDGDEGKNIPGAVKLGMSRRDANLLFDTIAKFADYGFNKSHALAYATIAYQTMWLKTHHPAEFFAAAISIEMESTLKKGGRDIGRENITKLMREARLLGVSILMPDINRSEFDCVAETPNSIRLGLGIIKGISSESADFKEIRAERSFTDIVDFFERCIFPKVKIVSKTGKESQRSGIFRINQINAMVAAGVFDSMQPNRGLASAQCKVLNDYKSAKGKNRSEYVLPMVADPWLDTDRREYVATGLYLTEHPVGRVAKRLRRAGIVEMEHVERAFTKTGVPGYPMVRIAALPQDIHDMVSKSGSHYSRVRFGSQHMEWDALLFPPRDRDDRPAYEHMRNLLEQAIAEHRAVVIACSITFDDSDKYKAPKVIVERAIPVDPLLHEIEKFDMRVAVIRAETSEEAAQTADIVESHMKRCRADHHAGSIDFSIRAEAPGWSSEKKMEGRYLLDEHFSMIVRDLCSDIAIIPNDPSPEMRRAAALRQRSVAANTKPSGGGDTVNSSHKRHRTIGVPSGESSRPVNIVKPMQDVNPIIVPTIENDQDEPVFSFG